MKKKISLLLCLMMTAIVCLTGCGKTQTTLEYDEAMIEQETEFLINYCQNVDSDTLERPERIQQRVSVHDVWIEVHTGQL